MEHGFTLIEVLVAAFIIITVSTAAISLVIRSEQLVDIVRDRFVAINLAREGIELVRVVRDTNWFTSGNWLAGGICEDENQVFMDADRQVFVDLDIVRTTSAVSTDEDPALYRSVIGRWTHDPSSGEDTNYSRVVTIDCSETQSEEAFVTVTALVNWESRGRVREVIVRDRLYNWLPTQ